MMWRPVPALTLLLFALSLASPTWSTAEDPGQAAFEENCSLCHTLDRPRSKHLTRDEWKENINRMVGFGAQISSKKRGQILDYLARTQGATTASTATAYIVNERSQDVWVIHVVTRTCALK